MSDTDTRVRAALAVVPISISDACELVRRWHRHHRAPVGGLFAVAVAKGGEICGAAIVGRPVSRILQDGWTVEVTRCVTNGEKNACSMLYAAAWRAAKALGYKRLITYVLADEPGTSLRAAGWKVIGESAGGTWNRASRPRIDKHPLQRKIKWGISTVELGGGGIKGEGVRGKVEPVSDVDGIGGFWPADDDPDNLLVFLGEERLARRRVARGEA